MYTRPCWLFHRTFRWVLLVHEAVGLVPNKGHVVVLADEVLSHQVLQIPGVDVDAHITPADAITPVAPVGVDTHRPEDQTLNENSSGSSGEGQKSFRNLSKRNRDTAAGDGWAINISLSAGGMRVSDSEPLIVTARRCRFWIAASSSPSNSARHDVLEITSRREAEKHRATAFHHWCGSTRPIARARG